MSSIQLFLRRGGAMAALGGLLLLTSQAHAAATYRIDALNFTANGINSSGLIVGSRSGSTSSFVYNAGTTQEIALYGGAVAVSDNGLVLSSLGYVYDTRAGTLSAGASELHSAHSGVRFTPAGINNDGTIVGTDTIDDVFGGDPKAIMVKNGQAFKVPSLGGNNTAVAVNNHGSIVGASQIAAGFMQPEHAYQYTGSTLSDLGALPGGWAAQANAINDAGQIAGASATTADYTESRTHAFITSPSGLVDLGVLSANDASGAADINNLGEVVGYSGKRAFLYSAGVLQDLNTLLHGSFSEGWVLESARGISDNGTIFGSGIHNGVRTDFVLTPVPEPATMILLGAGLGVAGLSRRRSRDRE